MGEAVASYLPPVGPREQRRRDQKLPLSCQFVATLFDRQRILGKAGRDRRHGELAPEHTRRLEQALRLRVQASNLLLNQQAEALRNRVRNLVEGPAQAPAPVLRLQHAQGNEL